MHRQSPHAQKVDVLKHGTECTWGNNSSRDRNCGQGGCSPEGNGEPSNESK